MTVTGDEFRAEAVRLRELSARVWAEQRTLNEARIAANEAMREGRMTRDELARIERAEGGVYTLAAKLDETSKLLTFAAEAADREAVTSGA